ncbi:MAG: DUF938 domain-containing protein [Acidiferrobacterales bacterium]
MIQIIKPHADACDRNRQPILDVIAPRLTNYKAVLEIGSGTGQHAVYFAQQLPHLTWITSDRQESHTGIRLWLDEADLPNTKGPLLLDVSQDPWPEVEADAVFTANTVHIISWSLVDDLFKGVGRLLPSGGLFMVYGPFNYGGQYTSDSNASFDQQLKDRDAKSRIRNFEGVNALARSAGLELNEDVAMPANNRLLVWRKI